VLAIAHVVCQFISLPHPQPAQKEINPKGRGGDNHQRMELSAFAGKHADQNVRYKAVADSFRDAEGKRDHKNGKCCRNEPAHIRQRLGAESGKSEGGSEKLKRV